jgi:hypothetical protein
LKKTKEHFKGEKYTEQEFLQVFLDNRKDRLLELAAKNREKGLETDAKYLEKTADYRINSFKTIVDSGNLNLEGKLNINGNTVQGFKK